MATAFVWTRSSEEFVLITNLPWQQRKPGHFKRRYISESEDGSVRSVLTVGSGLKEVTLSVNDETQGDTLDAMIEAGIDGLTITLRDLSTGQEWPAELVGVGSRITVENERAGTFTVRDLTFRRVDGGVFA